MARSFTGGLVLGMVAVAGFGAAAFFAFAGPLDPPSVAVASTYKTLSEVEPRDRYGRNEHARRCELPLPAGSHAARPHHLTGNITGVSGKSGIEIAAARVTLDLTDSPSSA